MGTFDGIGQSPGGQLMKGLSSAGSWQPDGRGGFAGEVTEDWTQGRTAFGGLLVTAAVRAMQTRVEPERRVRSALVAFVAPVSAGGATIAIDCLREGKSLTFLQARVRQADRTCTLVTGCFGAGRSTCLHLPGPARPEAPSPEGLESMPYLQGVTPAFTRHFDVRWTSPYPFSGAGQPRVQGWVRSRDDANLDTAGVLSLVDAWPPPEITLADRPYPLSSVAWQINLVSELPAGGVPAEAWWFFDSHTVAADGGYTDSWGRLWDPDGRLFATSRQLVAEFFIECQDSG